MGKVTRSIAQILNENRFRDEIVTEAQRIADNLYNSERSVSSFRIFQGMNPLYVTTIGRDALDILIRSGYVNTHKGEYFLSDEGRATFPQ
jgi:hypothetical protein